MVSMKCVTAEFLAAGATCSSHERRESRNERELLQPIICVALRQTCNGIYAISDLFPSITKVMNNNKLASGNTVVHTEGTCTRELGEYNNFMLHILSSMRT